MATSTQRPTAQHLSDLFDQAQTDSRLRPFAENRIARTIQALIGDCLRLPLAARPYRLDCVQELTLGLYRLLERWHREGTLEEVRSLPGLARQYVRWHLPAILRRMTFRAVSPSESRRMLSEGELSEFAGFHALALERAASGIHQDTGAAIARNGEESALERLDRERLPEPERHIILLLETGETSRRRIELALIERFGFSHRQARRTVLQLAERLAE